MMDNTFCKVNSIPQKPQKLNLLTEILNDLGEGDQGDTTNDDYVRI